MLKLLIRNSVAYVLGLLPIEC